MGAAASPEAGERNRLARLQQGPALTQNARMQNAKCNIAPALHAWRGLLVVPWSLYCEKCPTGISIAIEEYAPTPFLLSA